MRSALVVLVFVAALAGQPAYAAAPDVTVTAASGATTWLVAGGTASLAASVANSGDAPATQVSVQIVVTYLGGGDATTPLTPGTTVASLAKGASATVKVSGAVPKTLAQTAYSMQVCADAGKTIEESDEANNCRDAGTLYVSGPGALEKIDAAAAAGAITEGAAALYRIYAVTGDQRLPAAFRGALTEAADGFARAAATDFGSFTAAEKRTILPYLMPPRAADSGWSPHDGLSSAARRTTAEQGGLCRGFDNLSRAGWRSVPSSNGKALVWYEETDTAAAASARTYATALGTEIWPKLVREFGPPKSDGAEGCYHGPDGRLDVYVSNLLPAVTGNARDVAGVAMPYPADGPYPVPGKFCTNRPAWIAIKAGLPNWVLAHEFMHVLQFAHKYKTCDGLAWWDEGQATWAGDFVYPNENVEHNAREQFRFGGAVAKDGVYLEDYDAWPFWYFLAKTQGIGVLKKIFTQLRNTDSATAVNRAIPGGMKAQLPKYGVANWNDQPIGASGFPVRKSFRQWDGFKTDPFPWNLSKTQATLKLLPGLPKARKYCFYVANPTAKDCQTNGRALEPAQVEFQVLDATMETIEEIVIKNGLYRAKAKDGSRATVSLQAMLEMTDGTWKLEDWTNRKEISFCRVVPEEDVRRIVLVQANAWVGNNEHLSYGGPKGVTGKFEVSVRASCSLFFRVTGGTATVGVSGTHVVTFGGMTCSITATPSAPFRWTFSPSAPGTIDMTVLISRVGIGGLLKAPGKVVTPGGSMAGTGDGCGIKADTLKSQTLQPWGPSAAVEKGGSDQTVKLKFADLAALSYQSLVGAIVCDRPFDEPPPGNLDQDVPLDTLRSADPITLTVSATWPFQSHVSVPGLNDDTDCTNTYNYSVNLQRVNEDGSPLE